MYIIRTFEGDEISCSADELHESLSALAAKFRATPTLVNLYDGEDRIAIVGLGSVQSTVQCVDKRRGISSRALAAAESDAEDVEFVYQGEATFVPTKYLVPEDIAILAVVHWLTHDQLIPKLRWRSREYPPR
jgi:Immunity protein Imm1